MKKIRVRKLEGKSPLVDYIHRAGTRLIGISIELKPELFDSWLDEIYEELAPDIVPQEPLVIRLYTQEGVGNTDDFINRIKMRFDDVAVEHIADVSASDIQGMLDFVDKYNRGRTLAATEFKRAES